MSNIISGLYGLLTITTSLIVFGWNWWIHKSYHDENSFLNKYKWFKKERKTFNPSL